MSPPLVARPPGLMVVDDEEAIRSLLELRLRRDGYGVWQAVNGLDALSVYRRHRAAIDVVVMDVRMPILDGPRALEALKVLQPDLRCCMMSGDLGNYTEAGLIEMGAAVVVMKPFRLDEMARVVARLAGRPEPIDDARRPPIQFPPLRDDRVGTSRP